METRDPIGLKMVFIKCFHVITFVTVDTFPWNFNTVIFAIENGGSILTGLETTIFPQQIPPYEIYLNIKGGKSNAPGGLYSSVFAMSDYPV